MSNRIWLTLSSMFFLICILLLLDEVLDLPHLLLGAPQTPINWREAIIEMVMVAAVGIFSVLILIRNIAVRKRAEEKVEHLNLVLRAVRNVNQLITKEKDRDRLLQRACDNLIETRGYHDAWIALLDKSGELVTTAEAGLGDDFLPIVELLRKDELTACGRKALKQSEAVVIEDPLSTCIDCPFSEMYGGRGAMTIRLEYNGTVYGVLSVSALTSMATDDEELGLFEEVAGDIAFALYSIELEEKRKQAEEQTRKLEEYLRLQIDRMPIALIVWDTEFRVQSWNPAAEKIFGFTAEEALRKHPYDLIVPKEAQPHVDSIWRRLIEGDMTAYSVNENITKDGRAIICDWSNTPLKEADSTMAGVLSMVQDITEHKQLEDQFRQSQKMEGIGRLAGGIAHDFNNLLTVISGHAELASVSLDERDPLKDDLKEIQNAAHRAAELTRQLLAFSRKQTLQPQVLDLNDIVRELDKMLKRVIGEDIGLETIAAPDLWSVNADPGQIEQVIINLAINARDAMPGGGKLVIETENVELDEEYTDKHPEVKPGPHVMLAISDTGCGMTEEVKAQVFEPFFTTKEEGKGTGLGLSTVYGIVKQSGGSIWVYSELDEGTTFKVYLPMVTQEADELSREADVSEAPRGTETILLVEDEEGVRKLAVRILKEQGYKVLEAESGVDALLMCQNRKKPVDIVVTDVIMPNMSGVEFIEKLREFWSDFKVLYMSGYTSNAIVHAGVLDKDTPYLQKPFRPVDIASKVRNVLDSKADM